MMAKSNFLGTVKMLKIYSQSAAKMLCKIIVVSRSTTTVVASNMATKTWCKRLLR